MDSLLTWPQLLTLVGTLLTVAGSILVALIKLTPSQYQTLVEKDRARAEAEDALRDDLQGHWKQYRDLYDEAMNRIEGLEGKVETLQRETRVRDLVIDKALAYIDDLTTLVRQDGAISEDPEELDSYDDFRKAVSRLGDDA